MSNDIVSNRSTLKEFLASIATISGDLSNITAPPFVLAENSTVEIPQYWADHPLLFVAPASEPDAEKRALLVLKWFLGSLRNQQYAGRREEDGVKKPLNAFLGELFFGSWQDEELGETRLVSEQVSHHPPVTACYLWNDRHGIRAEGFTQQEITFSGSVSIKQKGYAVLHIDKYDEDYLIPVPNVKVKGIISGVPYPELHGEYSLISSNGYVSHIKFEGKSLFGSGQKNGFEARLFHTERPKEDIYTVEGAWNGRSTIIDARSGTQIDNFDVMQLQSAKLETPDLSEQDPWESRRAWGDVIAALRRSDMKGTTVSKSLVEEGQRRMRKDEEARGERWKNVFFRSVNQDSIFEKLSVHDNGSFTVDRQGGVWKVDPDAVRSARKPYHGDLLPTNERVRGGQSGESRSMNGVLDERRHETAASAVPVSGATSNGIQDRNGVDRAVNDDAVMEEQRAKGVAEYPAGFQRANGAVQEPQQQSSGGASMSQEPTDAQVEAFLRAKHSSLKR